LQESEVDGTSLGSCKVGGFGINHVEPSGSATALNISCINLYLIVFLKLRFTLGEVNWKV